MRTCVVKGCGSKGSSIRFHSFPVDPIRRQLWLSAIQPKRELKEGTSICELHFKPKDYDDRGRLRQDALPGEPRMETNILNYDCRREVDEICRVCLASDRKTFGLRERTLKQAYNDVSGIKFTPDDGLPNALCYSCRARVVSAARCRAQARAAHTVLSQLLKTHGAITKEAVSSVDLREKNLLTQPSHKHVNSNDDYVYVSEDPMTNTNEIKPISNVDIKNEISYLNKEFIDETHYDDYDNKNDIIFDIEIDENDDSKEAKIEYGTACGKIDKADNVNDLNGGGDLTIKITKNDTCVKEQAVKRKRAQKQSSTDKRISQPKQNNDLKDFTITKVSRDDEIAAVMRRKESTLYKDAPYKCEVCYRGYKAGWQYEAHVPKHTDKYGTFECPICKMRYKTKGKLNLHTNQLHSKKFECNNCPFVSNNKSAAFKHVIVHSGTRHQCPHCPRLFENISTFYSHLRLKHACAEPCEYCGHTFLNKFGVIRHKTTVHKFHTDMVPLEGPYCAPCDVKFASQEAHDKHLTVSSKHRTHESPYPIRNAYHPPQTGEKRKSERKKNRQPIDCELCGVTLANKSVYAGHFRREHRGLARARPVAKAAVFMCEQCGNKFQSMSLLSDHNWVHTGLKKFQCDTCQKSFSQKCTLVGHMALHGATRPSYECPICAKQFSCYSNKRRHMFIHTGRKPFKCETCGKSFTTSGEQRAHVEHVHLKKPWPKRQRARDTEPAPWAKLPPTED